MLRAPTVMLASLWLTGCVGEILDPDPGTSTTPPHGDDDPHTDGGAPDPGADGGGIIDTDGGSVDGGTTTPTEWVAFEDEVVTRVNQQRAAGATCGGVAKPAVGPLVVDAALREAARCHSLDMAVNAYFSHTSLDGSTPWDRIAAAGYTGSATAENIAAGYATPQAVVEGWMTSTGHCNNIMGSNSNETGVGYAYLATAPWGHYWTETFGHR